MRVVGHSLKYVHARRIGAEVALHALLVHLHGRGHEVAVAMSEFAPAGLVDGVRAAPVRSARRLRLTWSS